MGQIFHPSTNTFAKATIFGGVFVVGALFWAWGLWVRSSYATQVNIARDQPVPFSHEHHVNGLGLDCRYCHTSVEKSSFAGIPPTETCMGCHSQIWRDSPMLEPVRESFRSNKPLNWNRVHDLPDFAYFDHSIHVSKGVACQTCHGRVDKMPLMWKANTLQMEWCLNCHFKPQDYVGPKELVFHMGPLPPGHKVPKQPYGEELFAALMKQAHGQDAHGAHSPVKHEALVDAHYPLPRSSASIVPLAPLAHPNQLTNCSTCHR